MSSDVPKRDEDAPGRPVPKEPSLPTPDADRLLSGVLTLGREVHLEMDEAAVVELFLSTLGELFPRRLFAVRVLDPRSVDDARCYAIRGSLRQGVARDRIALKSSSVSKTRLKRAVVESARVKLSDRWDSPFTGVAAGFAVPLVASGELYGVLDVGYPLGHDLTDTDEPMILPLANHLSVALRNERLHRDSTLLRDYQAKLIEHANALILGVDRRWRITVCNQALCRLLGVDRSAIIGRDLRDWLPEDERPRLTKLFLQVLGGGGADTIDVPLETASGERTRTVWSVAAISGRGHVEAVVAIGQDQTKLRELQSQVIQAEKLATLGQLAAGVVHELNNPLTSITVYAEYLLKRAEATHEGAGRPIGDDPADVEKLRRIAGGAQRILGFARDLVQYAKPAGDELDVVALDHVVRHSLSFCEHMFEGTGATLETHLSSELPAVYAVPGQLEQVLINLVTNAVHAVSDGGRVVVRTFPAGGGRVGLSVADDGEGIAPDDRDRVFEPFFTTKTDGQGTGLGLSIVHNIVEQHGGTVSVDRAEEGGAAFTVLLPVTR